MFECNEPDRVRLRAWIYGAFVSIFAVTSACVDREPGLTEPASHLTVSDEPLWLEVSSVGAAPGERLSVSIGVDSLQGFVAVAGRLRFDPRRLRYDGISVVRSHAVVAHLDEDVPGSLAFVSLGLDGLSGSAGNFSFTVLASSPSVGLRLEPEAAVSANRSVTAAVAEPGVRLNPSLSGSPQPSTEPLDWLRHVGSVTEGMFQVPPTGGLVLGDCRQDSRINILDVLDAALISVGRRDIPQNPVDFRACDVIADGMINFSDVLDIAEYNVGLQPRGGSPVGLPFRTRALATGETHTCALDTRGRAFCWGMGSYGPGDGFESRPVLVSDVHSFVQLAAGNSHTCGLASNGTAYCWGSNGDGELGNGTLLPVSEDELRPVVGGTRFVQIAGGEAFTCGLAESGQASCWGRNPHGQLGNGTTSPALVPSPVVGSHEFVEVATGTEHACGLDAEGTVHCWGRNDAGQLGDPSMSNALVPRPVEGLPVVVHVSASERFTCAVAVGGAWRCWGANADGQLGDGTTGTSTPPSQGGGVVDGPRVYVVSDGKGPFACGLFGDGLARCWGSNDDGQLGDGTTMGRAIPSAVRSEARFVEISTGGRHACGQDESGDVWCWGRGDLGQLGTGTDASSSVPSRVPALGEGRHWTVDSGAPANPSLLSVASGQRHRAGEYPGRALRAGQTYEDPVTGVRVVKLTDSETPFAGNSRGFPDYSEGGPYISQPWQGAGGGVYYTVYVAVHSSPGTHYFVDVKHPELTLHNWRQLQTMENRDLMWAWSLDPATPRVGYGLGMPGRNVIRRFDTGAMTEIPGGGFPKVVPEQANWLQVSVNDAWFAFQNDQTKTQYAWHPATDALHAWNPPGFNEGHLDRDGQYLYAVSRKGTSCFYGNVNTLSVFRLSDGAEVQPSPAVAAWPAQCQDELWNTHIAGLRSRMVTHNPNASLNSLGRWNYEYDPAKDSVRFHESEQSSFAASGHRAGQWVFGNNQGNIDAQWYLVSNWGSGGQNHALFDAIAFINIDARESVHLLAHHYSHAWIGYFDQPHATISPDGKLVMWGSNMLGSGRIDAFLAAVPTG